MSDNMSQGEEKDAMRDIALRLATIIIGQNRRGATWCPEVWETLMSDLQDARKLLGADLIRIVNMRFPLHGSIGAFDPKNSNSKD